MKKKRETDIFEWLKSGHRIHRCPPGFAVGRSTNSRYKKSDIRPQVIYEVDSSQVRRGPRK